MPQRTVVHLSINLHEKTLLRGISTRNHSFRGDLLFGSPVGPRLSINNWTSFQPVLARLLDTLDQCLPVGRIPTPEPQPR